MDLRFILYEDTTRVHSKLSIVPNYKPNGAAPALVLDGAGLGMSGIMNSLSLVHTVQQCRPFAASSYTVKGGNACRCENKAQRLLCLVNGLSAEVGLADVKWENS